ncbi:MAG: endo-1,4-beta-xylanase [bacterium]
MTSTIGIAVILAISSLVLGTVIRAAEDNPLSSESIDRRIQQHRTSEIVLTIIDPSGKPAADTSITVEMKRHKFLFGCNAFALDRCGTDEMNTQYADHFAALLNYATLPFYWGSYESEQGKNGEAGIRKMAEWCRRKTIRAKGHPLCWHELEPVWLTPLPTDKVETLQMQRIRREVAAFHGLIDTWDVVNEAVAMPAHAGGKKAIPRMCQSLGQVGLIRKCFAEARQTNPRAILLLNDFVTDSPYEKMIENCIKAGVTIDAIGIQSHMHTGYREPGWVWETCERFGRFGKPLHFTELTILSGKLKTDNDWFGHHPGWDSTPEGERLQAVQAEEIYRVLFSHPAVEAITWWDFSDLNAWQGAPAGLMRKDMTPKPAYNALMALIRGKWWTGPLTLRTDKAGKVTFRGYLGTYVVEANTLRADLQLINPGKDTQTVKLTDVSPNKPNAGGGK